VHHPFRIAPILDAGGQAVGDLQALLDRRQKQDAAIRGQPPAVKADLHRLAPHRWQTRQNPRTIVHGGRELRCFGLIRPEQPNHTRNQRFIPLPPTPPHTSVNYSG
jgi:hypothetical protein